VVWAISSAGRAPDS